MVVTDDAAEPDRARKRTVSAADPHDFREINRKIIEQVRESAGQGAFGPVT